MDHNPSLIWLSRFWTLTPTGDSLPEYDEPDKKLIAIHFSFGSADSGFWTLTPINDSWPEYANPDKKWIVIHLSSELMDLILLYHFLFTTKIH